MITNTRQSIEAVVGDRIQLKKVGSRFTACCPFHDEKTPSFYVFPDTGKYHCFGCGERGDEIDFIMKYNDLTFYKAMEVLGYSSDFKPDPLMKAPTRKFKPDRILFEVVWQACMDGNIDQIRNHHNKEVREYGDRFDMKWTKDRAWYEMIKDKAFLILHRASPEDEEDRTFTNSEVQDFWDYLVLLDKEYNRLSTESWINEDLAKTFIKICQDESQQAKKL